MTLKQLIEQRMAGRGELRKVITNTGWLVTDNVIQIFFNLFVGVFIARHLGPDQRGVMIYATAFTSIFVPISALGLGAILVRELVAEPDKKNELMGTVFLIQSVAYLLIMPIMIGLVLILRGGETLVVWSVVILALGSLFSVSRVFNFWFQSQLQSKYIVLATRSVEIITAVLKILLILLGASVLGFVGVLAFQVFLYFVAKLYFYSKGGENILSWRFDLNRAKGLLRDSWPLIFSVLAVTLYTEIDNLLLGQLLDNHAVGVYGEATRSVKMMYFIPAAIAASVYPTLVSARKTMPLKRYERRIQQLLDVLALTGYGLAIPLSLAASYIVSILYGPAYAESGKILSVYVWTFIFISLRYGLDYWLMVENQTRLTLLMAVVGLIMNVGLDLLLIPILGAIGAAWATLISMLISISAICLIFPQLRSMFRQLILAIFIPFRFYKLFNKKHYAQT